MRCLYIRIKRVTNYNISWLISQPLTKVERLADGVTTCDSDYPPPPTRLNSDSVTVSQGLGMVSPVPCLQNTRVSLDIVVTGKWDVMEQLTAHIYSNWQGMWAEVILSLVYDTKTSLLHRRQVQTLPNATPSMSKMAITGRQGWGVTLTPLEETLLKNIARIAKRCSENISSVVKVSKCFY